MIIGHVRDKLPRVILTLAGREERVQVEFVVDTGFDGALAVPPSVLNVLDATFVARQAVQLAGKVVRRTAYYSVEIEWDGASRLVEAMLVDGRPLMGYEVMEGGLLQIEMTDGGEVSIDAS